MAAKQLSLRALSIPIFFELFLRYLSLIINTLMVAAYSNFLVGAMGAGNQILDIFITIFTFLSIGCSVVITQAIGAKDKALARKAIHQSLFLNSILGLICAIGILWQGEQILELMNVPNELMSQSTIYLYMLGICLFFDAVGIVLASIIRVYNRAYSVMFVTILMDGITVLGNYYALNYTQSELLGVGLSTIAGRVVAIAILIFMLIYLLKFKPTFKEFIKIEKIVVNKILKIGGWAAGENLLWIIQYTIAFGFVASLGKENLSVQTIYFQISLFIMLIGQAISVANEIIIGKLVGAKKLQIAYKHTWRALYISILASFLVSLANFAFSQQTMSILNLNIALKELMIPLFALSIFLEVARTFNIIMVNSLRASGDARFCFYSGVVFMFGVSLPVGYILCFNFGLGILGIWIGFCADEALRGITNAWRWKSKKWQDKAVV